MTAPAAPPTFLRTIARHGLFRGYHSPLQTMVHWVITRVWLSPAPIALGQIAGLWPDIPTPWRGTARQGAARHGRLKERRSLTIG